MANVISLITTSLVTKYVHTHTHTYTHTHTHTHCVPLAENYRDADYFDLRSELDIMKSMEPHPNIINLLGVCSETSECVCVCVCVPAALPPMWMVGILEILTSTGP